MTRQAVLILLLLASLASSTWGQCPQPAPGALAWPDVYYYKFDEGQGRQVVNFAANNPVWAPYAVPSFENPNAAVGWETANLPPSLGGTTAAWDNGDPSSTTGTAGLNYLLANGGSPINQSYTIECWVRTHYVATPGCGGAGGWCSLGRLYNDYSAPGSWRCYIGGPDSDGANYYGGGFGGTPYPLNTAGARVADGTWHHIAWVYQADPVPGGPNGCMWTYVDGNLDKFATTVFGSSPGTAFRIGGPSGTGLPFGGVVDEFRWWGEARTQGQIQTGMVTPPSTPPNGLLCRFAGSTTGGTVPLLVGFSDFSVTAPGTTITNWVWDVDGDGMADYSGVPNPSHVYGTPNSTYTVTLTVTNDATPPQSDTFVLTNYINTTNPEFTLATTGQADVYLSAPPPPTGWFDGFTLLSFDTSGIRGYGWFFGLYPDLATIEVLLAPAFPGSPLHFIDNGNTSIYPYVPIVLGPGSATALVGSTVDAVVIYRDSFGSLMDYTGVARAAF